MNMTTYEIVLFAKYAFAVFNIDFYIIYLYNNTHLVHI